MLFQDNPKFKELVVKEVVIILNQTATEFFKVAKANNQLRTSTSIKSIKIYVPTVNNTHLDNVESTVAANYVRYGKITNVNYSNVMNGIYVGIYIMEDDKVRACYV